MVNVKVKSAARFSNHVQALKVIPVEMQVASCIGCCPQPYRLLGLSVSRAYRCLARTTSYEPAEIELFPGGSTAGLAAYLLASFGHRPREAEISAALSAPVFVDRHYGPRGCSER